MRSASWRTHASNGNGNGAGANSRTVSSDFRANSCDLATRKIVSTVHHEPAQVVVRQAPFDWDDVPLTNGLQLCAYPDCIGKDLKTLEKFLEAPALRDLVQGLHVLPVYKSSADRGFAPKCYNEMCPDFGTWEDVETLSSRFELALDLMVNHVGRTSPEFQDFERNGRASRYADLFIYWDDVFEGGEATSEELAKLYLRKPSFPCLEVKHDDGTVSRIWNTFSEDQIDINLDSEIGQEYVARAMRQLVRRGTKLIRLDAVGYLTKQRGTKCFFEKPKIWEYLDFLRSSGHAVGVELLAEVHEHNSLRKELADQGFWVYDFCLPMLVLCALHTNNTVPLRNWLATCPFRQFTCLDTHDGVGVPDVQDVMTEQQIKETEAGMCGCKEMLQFTWDAEKREFAPLSQTHQHNCTFYSSIQGRASWYLLARAIQMFTPGCPMVYYVGLLAGTNDIKLAAETGSERFMNRHYYGLDEALEQLERPEVKSLLALLKFRNEYPAFRGVMTLDESANDHDLVITWTHDDAETTLVADLETKDWTINYRCPVSGRMQRLDIEQFADAPPSCLSFCDV